LEQVSNSNRRYPLSAHGNPDKARVECVDGGDLLARESEVEDIEALGDPMVIELPYSRTGRD
jgi:hypothetical protein